MNDVVTTPKTPTLISNQSKGEKVKIVKDITVKKNLDPSPTMRGSTTQRLPRVEASHSEAPFSLRGTEANGGKKLLPYCKAIQREGLASVDECIGVHWIASELEGVKVALGNRGLTVEAARKIGKSGEPWYICN